MPRFNFKILTGSTKAQCQSVYDAITTPDGNTFYLFNKGGKAYLGEQILFDADSDGNDSRFALISANATAGTNFSAGQLLFITADVTLTDAQSTPATYTAKKGEIWKVGSAPDLIPENLTLNAVKETITKMITNGDIIDDTAASTNGFDATSNANKNKLITAGAVQTLIDASTSDSALASVEFFNDVVLVTLSASNVDTSGTTPTVTFNTNDVDDQGDPITATAELQSPYAIGDIGLAFRVQVGEEYDESESDNDRWVFINLKDLITKSTETGSSFATKVNSGADNLADGTSYDPTANETNGNLSPNKFVTESQLASILANLLKDYVRYDKTAYNAS